MLTCTISALTPCSAARKGLSSNTRHGDILINLFICWTASLSCSSTRLSPMGRKKSRNQGSSQTVSARRNGAHIGRSFFPLTATVQQGRDTLVISWRNNILSAFKTANFLLVLLGNSVDFTETPLYQTTAGSVEQLQSPPMIFSSLKLHQILRQSRSLQSHTTTEVVFAERRLYAKV